MAAGFRILREWGPPATARVAPAEVTGRQPALADVPRRRSGEVTAPSPATVTAGQARPVPLLPASRGVPYDARAVLGAAAAPAGGARVAAPAPDFTIFPVPSRHEAVVGVPLEPYPPLPVPRLHRSDDSISSD